MSDNKLDNNMMASAVEAGGSAMKSDSKDDNMGELYKLNQVWYRMPPTLSLVSKRTITKTNFQQVSYGYPLNQRVASVIFNTGEFQVSGNTSWLIIQAGIDKGLSSLSTIFTASTNSTLSTTSTSRSVAHAYLGQTGIMGIIEEATFTSASGTEVDRQQNKGLQQAHTQRNRKSLDYFNTAGEVQGMPGGSYQDCYDNKGFPGQFNTTSTTYTSPATIPTRGTYAADYSNYWMRYNQNAGAAGTNTTTTTVFDSTKVGFPYGLPAATGSVDVSFDSTLDTTFNPNPTTAPWFAVPLSELLGMFNPYMHALIPSQALAGGRLELRFKNMAESLIATGPSLAGPDATAAWSTSATATSNASTFLNSMQIYNIYLLLDSFQLNEGTLRRLNEAAAGTEGLSVMFDTWDWTNTPVTGLAGEAQVSQARSRILRSYCVVRDQGQVTNPWANSLASEAAINRTIGASKGYAISGINTTTGLDANNIPGLLVNSYQAQLGSLYFPLQPLTQCEDYHINSYYMWTKAYQDCEEVNAVSLSDFMGANGNNMFSGGNIVAPIRQAQAATTPTNATRLYLATPFAWAINWGSATYGFLAERSQLLQLSGLPISNARLLRHRFIFNYSPMSGTSVPRWIDVFTEYTRVMKVYLGGRIVMRE